MKLSIPLIGIVCLLLTACASGEKSYCELLDEPVKVEKEEQKQL